LIVMPDAVGENAAVAVDKLEKLGFTNIDLDTVDGRRPLVILPVDRSARVAGLTALPGPARAGKGDG
jgi:hypothetical protein